MVSQRCFRQRWPQRSCDPATFLPSRSAQPCPHSRLRKPEPPGWTASAGSACQGALDPLGDSHWERRCPGVPVPRGQRWTWGLCSPAVRGPRRQLTVHPLSPLRHGPTSRTLSGLCWAGVCRKPYLPTDAGWGCPLNCAKLLKVPKGWGSGRRPGIAPVRRSVGLCMCADPPASPQTLPVSLPLPPAYSFLLAHIHGPFGLFLAPPTPRWVLRPRGSSAGRSGPVLPPVREPPLEPHGRPSLWCQCAPPPAVGPYQRGAPLQVEGPTSVVPERGAWAASRHCPGGRGKLPAEEAGALVVGAASTWGWGKGFEKEQGLGQVSSSPGRSPGRSTGLLSVLLSQRLAMRGQYPE